jgi:hypothetical protein
MALMNSTFLIVLNIVWSHPKHLRLLYPRFHGEINFLMAILSNIRKHENSSCQFECYRYNYENNNKLTAMTDDKSTNDNEHRQLGLSEKGPYFSS